MFLKSSTYPTVTGHSLRAKVCCEVAQKLDVLGNCIKAYGSPSLPSDEKIQRSVPTPKTPQDERRERCRQIGQILRQAREQRSLSQQWLVTQTRVPLHQIQALEAGRVEELPEDVYLRGFIRKLGNILGLNGYELAASLPEQPISVVPTWYHPTSGFNLQFSSAHFYFGYATLLLGSVGGLSLLSEWAVPEASALPQDGSTFQQASERERAQEEAPARAGANMAPPERLDG